MYDVGLGMRQALRARVCRTAVRDRPARGCRYRDVTLASPPIFIIQRQRTVSAHFAHAGVLGLNAVQSLRPTGHLVEGVQYHWGKLLENNGQQIGRILTASISLIF